MVCNMYFTSLFHLHHVLLIHNVNLGHFVKIFRTYPNKMWGKVHDQYHETGEHSD